LPGELSYKVGCLYTFGKGAQTMPEYYKYGCGLPLASCPSPHIVVSRYMLEQCTVIKSRIGAMFVELLPNELAEWLAIAEFSYNKKSKHLLKYCLSMLTMDFNPHMGFKPQREVKVQAVDKFVDKLRKIQGEG